VAGILGQVSSGVEKIIEAANATFGASQGEIDQYFADYSGLDLYKLTLPDRDSVFS
jgi:hypothetical protein